MKLYQNITEKKMDNFLKTLGSSIEKEKLVEIMNDKDDLHGEYQCLQTPTEKHEKVELRWPKAPGDVYKKR
jgi:hypothetical protein